MKSIAEAKREIVFSYKEGRRKIVRNIIIHYYDKYDIRVNNLGNCMLLIDGREPIYLELDIKISTRLKRLNDQGFIDKEVDIFNSISSNLKIYITYQS